MAKAARKVFLVGIRIAAEIGVEVRAETMEEAIAQARNLTLHDLIVPQGDLNDFGKPAVVSAWDRDTPSL